MPPVAATIPASVLGRPDQPAVIRRQQAAERAERHPSAWITTPGIRISNIAEMPPRTRPSTIA